jgi:hypothetical protein
MGACVHTDHGEYVNNTVQLSGNECCSSSKGGISISSVAEHAVKKLVRDDVAMLLVTELEVLTQRDNM